MSRMGCIRRYLHAVSTPGCAKVQTNPLSIKDLPGKESEKGLKRHIARFAPPAFPLDRPNHYSPAYGTPTSIHSGAGASLR